MHARLAGVIAAAFALTSVHAFAAQQVWDQKQVTQIAGNLARAVSGVLDEFKKQPPATIASMQSHARFRLQDNLRLLESETHALHGLLEAGEGFDETKPIYDRIGSLAREARADARKQSVTEAVQKRVDQAEELWAQLTPYYERDSGLGEKE